MRAVGRSPAPQLELLPDDLGQQLRAASGRVDVTGRQAVQAGSEGLIIHTIGVSLNALVAKDGGLDPAVLKHVFQVRGRLLDHLGCRLVPQGC